MYDDAVKSYTRASELGTVFKDVLVKTNDVYKKSGWKAYVQLNLDLFAPQFQFTPFVVATFYARLDRKDDAIEWLEKSFEDRDFRMTLLSVAYEFDGFRDDPKFKELVHRMGLPE